MALFQMPKLSDTMEEGTILQWFAADGEEIAHGQPLVEIETDKATMTVDAPAGGVLHLMAAEGDVLPIGAQIAAIGEDAPIAPVLPNVDEERPEQTNIPVGDDGTMAQIGAAVDLGETYPGAREPAAGHLSAPPPESAPASAAAAPAELPAADGVRVKASPLARRLAAELGIDVARVRGTGPDGRVVRADVEAASAGGETALRPAGQGPPVDRAPVDPIAPPVSPAPVPPPSPAAAASPASAPSAAAPRAPGARTALSRVQKTVARRMVESTRDAPHFYLQRDVDATAAIALRRQLVEAAPDRGPSLNDLIIRAVALAAATDLDALRQYDGDALVAADGVHVGIAVAIEAGLLVPVLRDADRKTVGQIATESRDLATRARSGSLTPAELEGSTISVSNLGMFGIDRFSAVLNPPEPAIVAVGRAAPRPVVRDGEIVVREVMTLTMSVDHRALYGAEGAVLLGRIAEGIEQPHALVL